MARNDENGYDNAAALDREGIPALEEPVNADEGIIPPGEHPRAVDEFGTTAEEQRRGESLAQRQAQLTPETQPAPTSSPGRLVADGDEGPTDVDAEKDMVARAVDQAGTAPSAEEAAIHIER